MMYFFLLANLRKEHFKTLGIDGEWKRMRKRNVNCVPLCPFVLSFRFAL